MAPVVLRPPVWDGVGTRYGGASAVASHHTSLFTRALCPGTSRQGEHISGRAGVKSRTTLVEPRSAQTETRLGATLVIMTDGLSTTLRERFGFDALRDGQQEVVERVLGGGDALVVWPTGSGKSLCYQLPAVELKRRRGEGVTLVFSPLIALMEDQVSALREKGIEATYLNSTLTRSQREARQRAMSEGAFELVYATPERMTKEDFRAALDAVPGGVHLLAVDECHCVTRWGHDLRPAYQRVGEFRAELGSPTTIALTATATRAVREDVRTVLGGDEGSMPLFATGIDRPNLELRVKEVWDDGDKVSEIADIAERFPGTGIVYFALIKDLERFKGLLAGPLSGLGRELGVYHGRLSPKDKKRVYDRFINADPENGLVLLATNAFGMGVDKPDIRFIVHAQTPGSVEAYAQEIGRAGRDGDPSRCELLYSQDDLAIQHEFVRWQNPSPDLLMQMQTAIERNFMHDDFDADDLRLDVIGKGHAHGRGGGTVEQALITLAKHGAIEHATFQDSETTRYRFVRELDDSELDVAEIEDKTQRDLKRLLDIVNMTKADDVAAYLREYFELPGDAPSEDDAPNN